MPPPNNCCEQMIELGEGCRHMTCKCGYEFCFNCGKPFQGGRATCEHLRHN